MFSQQPKELKIRDNKKIKKDNLLKQVKIPPGLKKTQKKSTKITPKHSKEKKNHQSKNTNNQKQNSERSQYYMQTYQKPLQNGINNYFNSFKMDNLNKNCLRNQTSNKKAGQIHKNRERDTEFTQYSEQNDIQRQTEGVKNFKSPIIKKIKMLSSKGAIYFNGDIARRNRVNSNHKKSYYQQMSENIDSCKQKTKTKSKSKSRKKKIRSKEKKKNLKKTKSKEIGDNPKAKQQQKINQEKDEFPFGTQFNIEKLQKDIETEADSVYQFILTHEQVKERGKCLNMIGKICSSMSLKRETYALTLSYIDSFIDYDTEPKIIKTVSIAALMMALKIDHAEMAVTINQSPFSIQSCTTANKTLNLSTQGKSTDKKSKRSQEKNSQDKKNYRQWNLKRPKLPNILTTVLSHEEIFSSYDRILCKEEIMDMQMQMMVKLNFKLTMTTFSSWIDILTILWDNYLSFTDFKLKNKLFFRTQQNFKNFAYLCQLTQMSSYFPYAYYYSMVIVVLSLMYLMIRIKAQYPGQNEEKGYQNYKMSLEKSSNIVFIDKMGINEIFGEFLGLLKLDLGDIINCCQYVSYYLNTKILKVALFQDSNTATSFEAFIGLYQYNPELHRFFQLKLGNQK